jgi:hypothetical protein
VEKCGTFVLIIAFRGGHFNYILQRDEVMEWYTFGQMLIAIRIGQKATTPDGRTLLRTSDGLFWNGGRLDGTIVEVKDYLFSDLWRIDEDEMSQEAEEKQAEHERKEQQMLENQYEELRAEYLEHRRELNLEQHRERGGQNG